MYDITFRRNKIKSTLAEEAARQHFEGLGYDVKALGIEHLLTQYELRKLRDPIRTPHIDSKLAEAFMRLPDFLVSRAYNGEAQVLLIEAKFRSKVVIAQPSTCLSCDHCKSLHLYESSEQLSAIHPTNKICNHLCLGCRYSFFVDQPSSLQKNLKQVKRAGNILFYLVAREARKQSNERLRDRVFLNLAFKPQWFSTSNKREQLSGRDANKENSNTFSIYRSSKVTDASFATVYDTIIMPALNAILGTIQPENGTSELPTD